MALAHRHESPYILLKIPSITIYLACFLSVIPFCLAISMLLSPT